MSQHYKDVKAPTPLDGIPVISPSLHVLAMPCLVWWRRNFGYAVLSPKSVFLVLIGLVAAACYLLYNDTPERRDRYAVAAAFALTTSLLYLAHLAWAFVQHVRKETEHDQYAGDSHLLMFLPKRKWAQPLTARLIEPAITITLGWFVVPGVLGLVLVSSGIALALREQINAWVSLRAPKIIGDSIEKTKGDLDQVEPPKSPPISPGGRTEEERRGWDSGDGASDQSEK